MSRDDPAWVTRPGGGARPSILKAKAPTSWPLTETGRASPWTSPAPAIVLHLIAGADVILDNFFRTNAGRVKERDLELVYVPACQAA